MGEEAGGGGAGGGGRDARLGRGLEGREEGEGCETMDLHPTSEKLSVL